MMTDPISDMLTRIRNALASKHEKVVVPFSKLKMRIAQILEQEKYVGGVKEAMACGKRSIEIKLRYNSGASAISLIRRISKPGLRRYTNKDEIPTVLRGYGIAVISTPAGLMTNKDAKKRGVGGEIICEVY